MKSTIIFPAVVLAGVVLLLVTAQTAFADQGYDTGKNFAQQDWNAGVGPYAGCTDHGINPVGNENFCISFKLGYLAEWATLIAAK
jgi:hypothetical protein